MAGKAKKVTKGIRAELAELKRKQRERMKAAGETPQSLKKKRDQRRAEAAAYGCGSEKVQERAREGSGERRAGAAAGAPPPGCAMSVGRATQTSAAPPL